MEEDHDPLVAASGERSVAVGGDIQGNVVVGDRYISGLSDLHLASGSSEWIYRQVEVERFVGRDWITQDLDRFLRTQASGYFILEGEAGVGKTTYLAWLSKERDYVSHFVVDSDKGEAGATSAVISLVAQLITKFGLDELAPQGVLPPQAGEPHFLRRVLEETSRATAVVGDSVVIVLDALDEVEQPLRGNVLGLPSILPDGVFFVVSQRPVDVVLQVRNSKPFYLTSSDPRNVEDMRRFLRGALTEPAIAQAVEPVALTRDELVEMFLDRSDGLWIYAHFVLNELRRGTDSVLDLNDLPRGLEQYFAVYWQGWARRNKQTWLTIDLKALGVLAAVQEPVSVANLNAILPHGGEERLRLLARSWRPFLRRTRVKNTSVYELYHLSLRRFLEKGPPEGSIADDEVITASQQEFRADLREAVAWGHSRIADHFLEVWGGLTEGLPNLSAGDDSWLSGYGVRHQVTHLLRSARLADVRDLLMLQSNRASQTTNVWFTARAERGEIGAYLGELDRTIRAVTDLGDEVATVEPRSLAIELALLSSSVRTLGQRVSGELLATLVERNVLTCQEAVGYTSLITYSFFRSDALIHLAKYMDDELLNQTLHSLRKIDSWEDFRLLEGLTPHVPEPMLDKLLSLVLALDSPRAAEILRITAPRLNDQQLNLAVTDALGRGGKDAYLLLQAVAPSLSSQALSEILTYARKDHAMLAWIVAAVREQVPQVDRVDLLPKVLAAADRAEKDARLELLTALAAHPDPSLKSEVLERAQNLEQEERGPVFTSLASDVDANLSVRVFESLQSVPADARPAVVERLLPRLPEAFFDDVFGFLTELPDWTRARLIEVVADRLEQERLISLLSSYLDSGSGASQTVQIIARKIGDEGALRGALGSTSEDQWLTRLQGLAPVLSESILTEIGDAARSLPDRGKAAIALALIAPHLPREEQEGVFAEALVKSDALVPIRRLPLVAYVLPHLSDSRAQAVVADVLALLGELNLGDVPSEVVTRCLNYASHEQLAVVREGPFASCLPREDDLYFPSLLRESNELQALIEEARNSSEDVQVEKFHEAIALAGTRGDQYDAVFLVRELPSDLLRQGLNSLLTLDDSRARMDTISQLVLSVDGRVSDEILRLAVHHTLGLDLGEATRIGAKGSNGEHHFTRISPDQFEKLLPSLPEAIVREAFSLICEMDRWNREEFFRAIAHRLPLDVFVAFLDSHEQSWTYEDSVAIEAMVPNLPAEHVQLIVSRLSTSGHRSSLISAVASRLSDAQLRDVLSEADEKPRLEVPISLIVAGGVSIGLAWASFAAPLALAITLATALSASLAAGLSLRPSNLEWLFTLQSVADFLSGPTRGAAFDRAKALRSRSERLQAYGALAGSLSEGHLRELADNWTDEDTELILRDFRWRIAVALLPVMPLEGRVQVLDRLLAEEDDVLLPRHLRELVPYLPDSALDRVVEAICGIEWDHHKPDVIEAVASRLTPPQLRRALECLKGSWNYEGFLRAIATELPALLREEIFARALERADARVLSAIAPALSLEELLRALDALLSPPNGEAVWLTFVEGAASDMPDEALRKIVEQSGELSNEFFSGSALAACAAHVSADLRKGLMSRAWRLRYEDAIWRVMRVLIPLLQAKELDTLVVEAAEARPMLRAALFAQIAQRSEGEKKADLSRKAYEAIRLEAQEEPDIGEGYIREEYWRQVLPAITPVLLSDPTTWPPILGGLSRHRRDDFLRHMPTLVLALPPDVRLASVEGLVRAVRNVGRWWP